MIELLLFYALAALAVTSGLGVVLQVRNTVYSALSLVVAMLAIAGLFVMLHAEFVGVVQVMVYAGAIVVLFLFVIMLLNLRGGRMGGEAQPLLKLVGLGVVLGATAKLVTLVATAPRPAAELAPGFGGVAFVGRSLYTDFVLAFQVAGVLLLAGLVGAVVLARREVD